MEHGIGSRVQLEVVANIDFGMHQVCLGDVAVLVHTRTSTQQGEGSPSINLVQVERCSSLQDRILVITEHHQRQENLHGDSL